MDEHTGTQSNTVKQVNETDRRRLQILYTNIRSLARNYDSLLLALQSVANENDYDVLALSETWIGLEQARFYDIEGYKLIIQPRTDGRRSGGVVLYIKKHLTVIENREIATSAADILSLKLKVGLRSNKDDDTHLRYRVADDIITVVLVYRDCKQPKSKLVRALETVVEENERNVIFLGDLNINILDKHDAVDYLNTIESLGFESIQNSPTRDNSCIDHVFFRSERLRAHTKILDIQITDHAIIQIAIDLYSARSNENKMKRVNILNEEKFTEYISKADWGWTGGCGSANEAGSEIRDVNKLFDRLVEQVRSCREKATRTVTLKGTKTRQQWANRELLVYVGEKSAAYKRYRADPQNDSLKNEYKRLSNRVKKESRKAKVQYYSGMLENSRDDPRKYWDIVNGVRGLGGEQQVTEIRIDQEIETVSENPDLIAEEFNNYFNQIPERLLSENQFEMSEAGRRVTETDFLEQEKSCEHKPMGYLKNFRLTPSDVEKMILKMKNKKSTGTDGISARVIKRLPKLFARILTPLYNESLRQGKFPDTFKIAIIVPILKNGDNKCIENYRPISLLSVFSKIFESCVHDCSSSSFNRNNKFAKPDENSIILSCAKRERITGISEKIRNLTFTPIF
jgi:Notch-like protein